MDKVLLSIQALAVALCWLYVGLRVLSPWLSTPPKVQTLGSGVFTLLPAPRESRTPRIAANLALYGLWSVLLFSIALPWLPKQPGGAQDQHQAAGEDQIANDLPSAVWDGEESPGSFTDPWPQADQQAANAQQDQRFAEVLVVPYCYDGDQRDAGDVDEGAVPPAGPEFFLLNHGAPSPVRSRKFTVHGGEL